MFIFGVHVGLSQMSINKRPTKRTSNDKSHSYIWLSASFNTIQKIYCSRRRLCARS